MDALVISDIHLGSRACQAKRLLKFLEANDSWRVILNGDTFDHWNLRKLTPPQLKLLAHLRSRRTTWLLGNHEVDRTLAQAITGVEWQDSLELTSGGRRILITHGHQWDDFLAAYPVLVAVADWVYALLQRLDHSNRLAHYTKRKAKKLISCVERVLMGAAAAAHQQKYHAVCCGHTHFPDMADLGGITYANSGCWTERPGHYLTIKDGDIRLHKDD
jgi:UDP-2,3-diacylglucosamine pyrophosphatase LpxH